METLIKLMGYYYNYDDLGNVFICRSKDSAGYVRGGLWIDSDKYLWFHKFPDRISMGARRLKALNELMNMGLVSREQAMKMVGLEDID